MSGNDDGQRGGRTRAEGSFEERLRAARIKQKIDLPAPVPGPSGTDAQPSAMGVGLRVGVEMVSALAVGVAIGWYLDRWLHSSPAFLVLFVLLGGAAGVANVWRVMGPKRGKSQRPT
jgi:ATP synthase protein I